ncbi:hypothetical protein [Sphingomonas phyllosphaerae]|uniref:hypothetical protein n=1 Tax=Sphingomonas phyllosphaerae TaxID=257003 RepID=UPI0012DEAC2B|nr:hypothetical protein [Sphingomonas phyllosphaerae]
MLPLAALFVIGVAGSSTPALASNQGGLVTKVAFAGPRLLFWVSGARGGARPGCDCCNRWELAVSDPNGQARMSLVLTAYAQGKNISIAGTGACVAGANDTEGVDYFEVS